MFTHGKTMIEQRQRQDFKRVTIAAGVGLTGLLLPLLLNNALPKPFKTALLAMGLSGFCASAAIAAGADDERRGKYWQALNKLEQAELDDSIKWRRAHTQWGNQIAAELEMLELLMQLPESYMIHYAQQLGLQGLLSELIQQVPVAQQTITTQAVAVPDRPMRSANRSVQQIDLADWHQQQRRGSEPETLYSECIRQHMIWTGNQGEGKTTACHYALYQWAQADPDLMIYWFDPHYGKGRGGDRFRSNWLGIPQLTEIPKNPQTGVLKGRAQDLLPFLEQIASLFEYRRTHNLDAPALVVGIDEFTNLLEQLPEQTCQTINNCLATFATEAPKFGINLWFICHSLTLDELGISRKILRQCHVVVGAEMSQDSVQVRNCPRSLPKEAIAHAQSVYRNLGKPAGFVTSLPVANGYLPIAPIESTDELLLDWEQQPITYGNDFRPDAEIPSDGDIYGAIAHLQQKLNRSLTDDELKNVYQKISGQTLNDQGITFLRDLLKRKGL